MGWKKRITGQLGNHTFQASLPWCCAEAVFFSHMQHYMCHMQLITAALHFKLWNLKHPFFLLFFLFFFLLFFYYKLKCHKRASHNLNVGVFVLFFCFFKKNLFTFFWVVFGLCSLLTQGRISRGRTAVCLCSYSLQSSTLKKKRMFMLQKCSLEKMNRWPFHYFFIFYFFGCWRIVTHTQLLNNNCLPASWRLFQKHFAIFNCHRITRKCHSV